MSHQIVETRTRKTLKLSTWAFSRQSLLMSTISPQTKRERTLRQTDLALPPSIGLSISVSTILEWKRLSISCTTRRTKYLELQVWTPTIQRTILTLGTRTPSWCHLEITFQLLKDLIVKWAWPIMKTLLEWANLTKLWCKWPIIMFTKSSPRRQPFTTSRVAPIA